MEKVVQALNQLSEKLNSSSHTVLSTLHTIRTDLEDPIYTYLRTKYGSFYKDFWNSTSIPKEAPNTILLVERRPHPNIEFVLQNAVYFCQKTERPFSLTIVCSDENLEYIKHSLGHHSDSVTCIPLFKGIGTREEGRNEYNKTFMSAHFWKSIQAEYILSIQTDSYLLRPLPEEFWNYDYIACPWKWNPGFVGGGGLTWRKREAILEMIEKEGSNGEWKGEDCFFSNACAKLDKKVPDHEEAIHYFVESCLTENPIGVHQWWTYWFPDKDFSEKDKEILFHKLTTLHHEILPYGHLPI